MTQKVKPLIILFLLCLPTSIFAEDDFQYRQFLTLKLIDTPKIDLVLFNQMQMNHDAHDISFYLTSSQLKFDFWKNVQLGINYSYVNLKVFNSAAGRDEFRFHHRLELEVNPHWEIGERLKITTRNRYEFRWVENNGPGNDRLRQRTNIEFPLKNVLPLQSVYANTEFFYNLADHRYNENCR